MRRGLSAVVLLSLVCFPGAAEADSWLPPVPRLASSEDGRWYVVIHPRKGWSESAFTLVRRAEGTPRREQPRLKPPGPDHQPRIELEPGDTAVARGRCVTPMELECLDDGAGFIRFDTYAQVGHAEVVTRYDGKGKARWSRQLTDLFELEVVSGFGRTVSSVWWYETVWIDEEADELVVVWRGADGPGVLRLALEDGAQRTGATSDILARIGRAPASEQLEALRVARKHKLAGLDAAVRKAFADEANTSRLRMELALYLHEGGDEHVRPWLLAAALEALAATDEATWNTAIRALQTLEAVPSLAKRVADRDASVRARVGAAHALLGMEPAKTVPARVALDRAANSGIAELEKVAKRARDRILRYVREQAANK